MKYNNMSNRLKLTDTRKYYYKNIYLIFKKVTVNPVNKVLINDGEKLVSYKVKYVLIVVAHGAVLRFWFPKPMLAFIFKQYWEKTKSNSRSGLSDKSLFRLNTLNKNIHNTYSTIIDSMYGEKVT